MWSQLQLSLLLAGSLVVSAFPNISSQTCNEHGGKMCYAANNGMGEDLDTWDIEDIAHDFRRAAIASFKNSGHRMQVVMPATDGECVVWKVKMTHTASVLVLFKHLNPRTPSSVLLSDVADTIDGGDYASATDRADSLLGCGKAGGQTEVKHDPRDAWYTSPAYTEFGYQPRGILVKLVRSDTAATRAGLANVAWSITVPN